MAEISQYLDRRPGHVRALYAFVLGVVLLYGGVWVYRYASITTDENWYDDVKGRVTIISVTPGGASDRAGLRVGDTIVAVNGNVVRNKYEANDYLIRGTGGAVLRYTILRDGRSMDIDVVIAQYGLPLQYLAAVITALLLILLASYVVFKRPTYSVARLFALAQYSFALALLVHRHIGMTQVADGLILASQILHPLLWPLTIALQMHTLLYFPVPKYVRPIPPPLLTALYVIPAGTSLLLIILGSVIGAKLFSSPLLPFLTVTAALLAARALLFKRMGNAENAEYAGKAKLVHLALLLVLGFVGGLLLLEPSSLWQALFLLGVAIPGLLFTTIVRQRIFDLYIVLRRRSLYSMLSISLTAFIIVLLLTALFVVPGHSPDIPVLSVSGGQVELLRLSSLSAEQRMVFEKRLTFTIGVFLAGLLWWAYSEGRRLLDRRFYRGTYDYKQALKAFSELSHGHSDMHALADKVVRSVVGLMHVRAAMFIHRVDGRFVLLASHGVRVEDEELGMSLATQRHLEQSFARSAAFPVNDLPYRELFARKGMEFLVGMRLNGNTEAMLLLGEKAADTNYSREDVELLENLSINVCDAMLSMRFYDDAREKERMKSELDIARRMQMQSLPTELPEFPGLDVAALSLPAYEVGGDFFDVLPRHNAATFLVGDVSGKGTSAAMYLARMQGVLKTIESYQPSLWELLARLNTQMLDNADRRSFVTLAALRFDFLSSDVQFIRAGHLPLLHYNALAGEVNVHRPEGMAVGLDQYAFTERMREDTLFARNGDLFVLVSDGVTEALNAQGEQFGLDGVAACMRAHAHRSAHHVRDEILNAVEQYSGGSERQDDATVLVVKCRIVAG